MKIGIILETKEFEKAGTHSFRRTLKSKTHEVKVFLMESGSECEGLIRKINVRRTV